MMSTILELLSTNIMSNGIKVFFIQNDLVSSSENANSMPAFQGRCFLNIRPRTNSSRSSGTSANTRAITDELKLLSSVLTISISGFLATIWFGPAPPAEIVAVTLLLVVLIMDTSFPLVLLTYDKSPPSALNAIP